MAGWQLRAWRSFLQQLQAVKCLWSFYSSRWWAENRRVWGCDWLGRLQGINNINYIKGSGEQNWVLNGLLRRIFSFIIVLCVLFPVTTCFIVWQELATWRTQANTTLSKGLPVKIKQLAGSVFWFIQLYFILLWRCKVVIFIIRHVARTLKFQKPCFWPVALVFFSLVHNL